MDHVRVYEWAGTKVAPGEWMSCLHCRMESGIVHKGQENAKLASFIDAHRNCAAPGKSATEWLASASVTVTT